MYVNVSVSGGRTSAYMAHWMRNNRQQVADYVGCAEPELKYVYTFANTGMEHNRTLRFMRDVDRYLLNNEVVWLEAVIAANKGEGTTHRVVDYHSAFRNTEFANPAHPYHATVMKYGICNVVWPACNREMKLNTINNYVRELVGNDYWTAVGIRADEGRVAKSAEANKIFYPLKDLHPCDKEDVLDFWKQYEWDLDIPEWQGNCIMCFKKSDTKLNQVWKETPEAFAFSQFIEARYRLVGPEFVKNPDSPARTVYRRNRTTKDMIAMFRANPSNPENFINVMDDGGCSESCEMYETETVV